MKKTSVSIGVLVAGVLMATSGFAGEGNGKGQGDGRAEGPRKGQPKSPTQMFARMDADSSGGVTLEEMKTVHEARRAAMKERRGDRPRPNGDRTPPPTEEVFSRMDADGDGIVTESEFLADAEARRSKRGKEERQDSPPPPPEEAPQE